MIRRIQLLEPEPRLAAQRITVLGDRIREGLLQDNKVVPSVLAVLALLVFAWLLAGVFTGDSGEEEEQRASNQASLGQASEEGLDNRGRPASPAPEVENRDADSFAAFKPKDPFRELIPKASEGKTESKAGEGKAESRAGESKAKSRADEDKAKSKANEVKSKAGEGKAKSRADEGEDFIDQSFPKDRGSDASGGGGTGQGGSGNLFNSGGDLAPPLPPP